jgi:YVTN family beta-propeller protein
MIDSVSTASPPARPSWHRRSRIAVIVASVVAATLGSVLLAMHDSGEKVTSRGVAATLGVPANPGSVAAGRDALWLALVDAKRPIRKKPLLRLDLASDTFKRRADVGGQASYLLHVGDRLLASVEHDGSAGSGPSLIVALDWRTGALIRSSQYTGAIGPLAQDGKDIWALQAHPAALIHLDSRTLTPKAAPLGLPPGRSLGLAVGAGHIWVTAPDAGQVLRIDPASRKITALRVGGFPIGIVVAGGKVWFADRERGTVARIDPRTLRSIGDPIRVGTEPSSLAVAGKYVFVGRVGLGTVTRIAVRSGKKIGAPIRFARPVHDATAFALAPAGTSIWVSSFASKTLTRISSTTAGAAPPPTTVSNGQQASAGGGPLARGAKVVAEIAVQPGGGGFAIGEGAVWSASDATSTLTRIDPARNAVVKEMTIDAAGEVAAGDGSIWLTHPEANTVSRIDPTTYKVRATIRVGKRPLGLAVTADAVWVANADVPSLSRIDPATNTVVKTIRLGPPTACCALHMGVWAAGGAVWVAVPNGNALARIDPATNHKTVIKLDFPPCAFVDADESTVWSAGGGCADVVARIDVNTSKLAKLVEPHPIGLAIAFGNVWVAALGSHNIDQIDLQTNEVVARLPVNGAPIQLLAGFGSVWVHDDQGRVLRIAPRR